MSLASVVIVGAGQAGFQVAASLRQEGYDGTITLIGDEPGLPYQRPPLSKAYLLGKITENALLFRPADFFVKQRIDLRHDQATAIDRQNRRVLFASGEAVAYDHLVLATGAHNRPLPVPGAELQGVYGVKTKQDADALAPPGQGSQQCGGSRRRLHRPGIRCGSRRTRRQRARAGAWRSADGARCFDGDVPTVPPGA